MYEDFLIQIPVKVDDVRHLPEFGRIGDAGADLRSTIEVTLEPHKVVKVPTGVYMAIPKGFEGQIRGRSGLGFKHGIGVVQGVGTIDSNFRGEICALLINHSDKPYTISVGERVCQR